MDQSKHQGKIFPRRNFIKIIGTGTGMLAMGMPSISLVSCSSGSSTLFEKFQNPSALAKPFYRWWWNGNRVTAPEIRRELRLIKESGAGGVEINPIALPKGAVEKGKALEWLSDNWLLMLKVAIAEAKKLDLVVDLIVGTGWPFGGKFLKKDETIQGMELKVKPVSGRYFDNFSEILDNNQRLMQLWLMPKNPKGMDEGQDILDLVTPSGTVEMDLPVGDYEVYSLVWKNKFREVMYGAPGGDGPVLDHFNKEAVEKYLNNMSDKLKPAMGKNIGKSVRSMFCDSIELEGANWTKDFVEEFEKRRGYAFDEYMKYLPLIMRNGFQIKDDWNDTLGRLRYDFNQTLSELFMERFIIPYHKWCKNNGVKSRYQSYGHPWLIPHMLDGYMVPDIPEGDQWLFNRGWVHDAAIDDIRYAIWNKYAASAGNLKGRKMVSSEAMTNTTGVFEASLEYIKQATDINIATGINHLVLHGFNYSPPEVGFPGWIRFGTYFNENNTWWPHTKLWANYTARLCAVMQESQTISQVAIMGPTADVWKKAGLDRNAFNNTPWYLHQVWQALNHIGYGADYINGTVLKNANLQYGEIQYGPMAYKLLIICDVKSIDPEVADKLLEFAKNGGKMIFVNSYPEHSNGLKDSLANDQLVKASMEKVMNSFPSQIKMAREPQRFRVTDWTKQKVSVFGIEPSVKISNPDDKLYFIHKKYDQGEIFFFANLSRKKTQKFSARFSTRNLTPWQWDPETGEKTQYPYKTTKDHLGISLKPLHSLLLVFEPPIEDDEKVELEHKKYPINSFEVEGRWGVELKPFKGTPFKRSTKKLINLAEDKELKHFSGEITYKIDFPVKNPSWKRLDLGRAHEIVEVRLNRKKLGTIWYGPKVYDIEGMLKPGLNSLEIKVTTLLFNHCLSLKGNPVIDSWLKRSARRKKVDFDKLQPLPSGLIGPVKLC